MNHTRIRALNSHEVIPGPIVYWMSRDQRAHQNWAFNAAIELGHANQQPVVVMFCLAKTFLNAQHKQYNFMLEGLKNTGNTLQEKNYPFYILQGDCEQLIPEFLSTIRAGALITDFSPLKIGRAWRESIAKSISFRMLEVDAHNIVPVWIASSKQEFGAYTIRPKIQRLLPEYLDEFPQIPTQRFQWNHPLPEIDWRKYIHPIPDSVKKSSGESAAHRLLETFMNNKMNAFDENRNDPNLHAQSHLSPYLHFGQISAQYIALQINKRQPVNASAKSFLEELIVRRELSDNYCFYNHHYDSFDGFPNWAKLSLNTHRKDPREYLYTQSQFEKGETHDELWNAAQQQMLNTGSMHGYLRMYWAKKILEWTRSPEEAMKIAIYLNDTYELDGRDPNGYTGIAWSIGGVHDRAWGERPIFGKIRYMNYNGMKKKFNVPMYINTWISNQDH